MKQHQWSAPQGSKECDCILDLPDVMMFKLGTVITSRQCGHQFQLLLNPYTLNRLWERVA